MVTISIDGDNLMVVVNGIGRVLTLLNSSKNSTKVS